MTKNKEYKIILKDNKIKNYNKEEVREKIIERIKEKNHCFPLNKKREYKEIIFHNKDVYTVKVYQQEEVVHKEKSYKTVCEIVFREREEDFERKKERITFKHSLGSKIKYTDTNLKDAQILIKHRIKYNPYIFNIMNMEFIDSIRVGVNDVNYIIWQDNKNNTYVKFC